MARRTPPLTNTQVKQAKPCDKEYNLVDGSGLSLRIKPSGTKSWLLNYFRPYSKKCSNLNFGTYPQVTLAEARKYREHARALPANNIDPKEQSGSR